ILLAWGFTPKVLAYHRKVRGVISGLADQTPRHARDSLDRPIANAGLRRFVEVLPAPAPTAVATSPLGTDAVGTVHQRAHAGSVRSATVPRPQADKAPLLRPTSPGQPGGVVGFLPVLRLVGQEFPPRFGL